MGGWGDGGLMWLVFCSFADRRCIRGGSGGLNLLQAYSEILASSFLHRNRS